MPVSQFNVYTWKEPGAPVLTGESGSLIRLLDACLVDGYGSKPPVGWTKPLPNEYGIGLTGSLGCWRQPSGSMLTMVVNDSPPTMSSGVYHPQEAWFHGWETIQTLTSSLANCIGTGTGNFPTSDVIYYSVNSSAKSSSCLVIRKSENANNNTPAQWIMFADAHTMYLFIRPDQTVSHSMYIFGDMFSLKETPDIYKCVISGRTVTIDNRMTANVDGSNTNQYPHFDCTTYGFWSIARSFDGFGTAVGFNKIGDSGKCGKFTHANPGGGTVTGLSPMYGSLPVLNSLYGNSLYLSPISICEYPLAMLRGRLRGLWMVSHQPSGFYDGQIISGSNAQAGKIFQIVKGGPANGLYVMEISNTVETNPPNS